MVLTNICMTSCRQHPAGVQIFYCHIPTVCALPALHAWARIILFLRNITRITIRLVLFRRNKIIIAHACSAGRHKPWVYDNKIFAPQRGAITSGKCYPVLNHSRNSIRKRRIHLHFMRSYKNVICELEKTVKKVNLI